MKSMIWAGSATMVAGCCAWQAVAGTIAVSSYTYNNLDEIQVIAGKDAPDGSPQSLIDGLGRAGEYVPAGPFWDVGEEGTIFNEHNIPIVLGQPVPSMTFDLGGVEELTNVVIHYGVRTPSGVVAPNEVDVLVDDSLVGTFGGFDNSDGTDEVRANWIDLTGVSGQLVELRIYPNYFSLDIPTTWVGLTEIEFNAIPEPTSVVLLGVGVAFLLGRRRRGV